MSLRVVSVPMTKGDPIPADEPYRSRPETEESYGIPESKDGMLS